MGLKVKIGKKLIKSPRLFTTICCFGGSTSMMLFFSGAKRYILAGDFVFEGDISRFTLPQGELVSTFKILWMLSLTRRETRGLRRAVIWSLRRC